MDIREFLQNNGIIILDGATGSLLLERANTGEPSEIANLSRGEVVEQIHREYFEAGANAVTANTFGVNVYKYDEKEVRELVFAALSHAKRAAAAFSDGKPRFIGLDVGPSGKMLKPFGDLGFEEAIEGFKKTISAGAEFGADYIFIETFNDLAEIKAAVIAAKEVSDLPVFVSCAFDGDGKLLSGSTPEVVAVTLSALGVDALGCNCSFGPAELLPVVRKLAKTTDKPIVFKPNAGIPCEDCGKTLYDVSEDDFARLTAEAVKAGARLVGGCCGTTPLYIKKLVSALNGIKIRQIEDKAHEKSVVCSALRSVEIGGAPVIIGERINPTGKKPLKEAIKRGDLAYVMDQAIKQTDAGADILDVNVGVPETDEPSILLSVTESLQAVVGAPLSIDTSNAVALEAALRAYIGKPLVNSVCGKRESMETVFPLVKKYGGAVICLTLDETGVPQKACERLEIAERIVKKAEEYGIDKRDLVFDALTMAISADPHAAKVCLETLEGLKKMGLSTVLGVSNVSYGLPARETLNAVFLAMALSRGLDAAIVDPLSAETQKVVRAFSALEGLDPMSGAFISFANSLSRSDENRSISPLSAENTAATSLCEAIKKGLKDRSVSLARDLLAIKSGIMIINEDIMPALDEVGQGFENKSVYLPQLLMSAECAKAAFDVIKTSLSGGSSSKKEVKIIVATVKGDVHDIGKNIVKLLLENYGFEVFDLGKDVSPELVLDEAIGIGADVVGLSALMTTTVVNMKKTIALIKEKAPHVKTMVGGAVLTEELAANIGADYYAKDALSSVKIAEELEKAKKASKKS